MHCIAVKCEVAMCSGSSYYGTLVSRKLQCTALQFTGLLFKPDNLKPHKSPVIFTFVQTPVTNYKLELSILRMFFLQLALFEKIQPGVEKFR